jgi:hypothetical protein
MNQGPFESALLPILKLVWEARYIRLQTGKGKLKTDEHHIKSALNRTASSPMGACSWRRACTSQPPLTLPDSLAQ